MNKSNSRHIKHLRSHQQITDKPKQDSSTEVNTVFCGPRVVFGARVNKKLKERFVEVAKREYGSVCRLQEALMAAVLAVTPIKVNSSKTVTIEKIVIGGICGRVGMLRVLGIHACMNPRTTFWYYDPDYPDDGGTRDYEERKAARARFVK